MPGIQNFIIIIHPFIWPYNSKGAQYRFLLHLKYSYSRLMHSLATDVRPHYHPVVAPFVITLSGLNEKLGDSTVLFKFSNTKFN